MTRKHAKWNALKTALELAALVSLAHRLGPRRAGRLAVATAAALLEQR